MKKVMLNMRGFMLALVLAFVTVIGCAQDKGKSMTVSELKEQIQKDPNLVVLDVRTAQELKGPLGQIDGAVNIPVQNLEERISEVEKLKGKKIAVICRTGNRSARAQQILKEHGINSINVEGGMQEYREKGY